MSRYWGEGLGKRCNTSRLLADKKAKNLVDGRVVTRVGFREKRKEVKIMLGWESSTEDGSLNCIQIEQVFWGGSVECILVKKVLSLSTDCCGVVPSSEQ